MTAPCPRQRRRSNENTTNVSSRQYPDVHSPAGSTGKLTIPFWRTTEPSTQRTPPRVWRFSLLFSFTRMSVVDQRRRGVTNLREDRLTIRELSSLRRPTEQQIERLSRGHVTVGVSGRRLLEPAGLRRSSRLTSRNPGEPVNNSPFTLLLGSTSCGNRPVRRGGSYEPSLSLPITDESAH